MIWALGTFNFFCLVFWKPLEQLIHFEFKILEAMTVYLENLTPWIILLETNLKTENITRPSNKI